MTGKLSQLALLRELEPVVESLLARHLRSVRAWTPSDYVNPDLYWAGRPSPLSETAKAALVTTLLTHNNIERSHRGRSRTPSRSAWLSWAEEWTAEKNVHADALRRYLVASRSVDPVALDRARLQCMTIGIESPMEGDHLLRSVVHSTVDVMATMVSHRGAAAECNDPVAQALLGHIVADQELHVAFHRDVVAAALDAAPAQTVEAITEVVMNFRMPGTGLAGFERSAMLLARDGIYDLRRHLDDVVLPALSYWRIFDRTDLGVGERSRSVLVDFLDEVEAQATTFEQVRLRARSREAEKLRAS